ncbi:hypothetical protein QTU67_002196 [Vibrio cholerae]|uniref:DUF4760 domain-containing protein n=1 Tax=Vibrio cholerae TaxID=666 RepID=UPI001D43064C|nr:hypothetical protein [Vibrio cholerae]EGR0413019.1 hypothetical protein [Vibrio cholerae]EGR1278934.1 hypothetical protein [Vibrio cholerae]EHC9835163.1 hypothetical protein [Vibrio cholerae]EIA4706724.1 hypothetical protein [Vibrio cholerae]EIJ0935286.1 hypothetical protein [Vibrio cholerae]
MSDKAITPADIATIIASITAVVTFIVSATTYVKSTSRERKTKTLDYWEASQKSLTEARNNLSKIHKGTWTEDIAKRHLYSSNRHHIISWLSAFERLAMGINLDIYDINVVNKLGGTLLVESFVAYAQLIALLEHEESPNEFSEFKSLYAKLEKMRK